MNNVIDIREYRNRDTIEVLETLLAMARRGKVTGIVAGIERTEGHRLTITGSYTNDPMTAQTVVSQLMHLLNQRIEIGLDLLATAI